MWMFGKSEKRALAQLWAFLTPYFSNSPHSSSFPPSPTPPIFSRWSRHPAFFSHFIFKAKLTAWESPSSWLYFSSCVILSLSSFYDFSPWGKNRKSYFFPSALQGVEQILNSMKWSCQGLKSFSGSDCLCTQRSGGVKHFFSYQRCLI